MKDSIGTWDNVADILNAELGYEYSESRYRKIYQQFNKMLNANQSKFVGDDNILEKNRQLLDEIHKERCKIQALNLEGNRYKRQDARFELFYENIAKISETLPYPILNRNHIDFENEKEYVLGFGDIHYGANFTSTNNEYSIKECEKRFGVLLTETESYVLKNGISKLKIINVGDSIQGILRLTDLQINEVPIVEAVVGISRLIAKFLNELSAMCDIEYYHVPMANHSQTRNLGSKSSELAQEDMEKIIVNYISDLLSDNDKVSVISNVGKDYIDFKIFDFNCFAMHGHQLKSTKECIKDMTNMHRKFYSYGFLGHTHSANEIIVGEENRNNIEVFTVPAFVGSCPYADSLFVGSKAMAKIYEFDSVYGHTGSKNIILN